MAYRRALALQPGVATTHISLGSVLLKQGQLSAAEAEIRSAIEFDPANAIAYNNLGNALKEQGKLDDAITAYRQALELDAGIPEIRSNLLLSLNNHPGYDAETVFREHRIWAEQYARDLPAPAQPGPNRPDPDRRLRIGYVSPDFRAHSVAYFAEALLEAHDRTAMHVVCYCNAIRRDDTTARLRGLADDWHDITGMGDEAVADRIRGDRIDILVDLAGHTANNRLMVFARKPAPVQVSYIGYCNTTGIPAMDYRITDALADPEGQDALYTEELVRLPRCFLCYTPPEAGPGVEPLPAARAGQVTFGSFNHLSKVTSEVIEVWSRILAAVPNARLLLKSKSPNDGTTRRRFVEMFVANGIAEDRVSVIGPIPSSAGHLSVYGTVDIALDPFPYNGTTTTCEALWMGVPVITLAGRAHAGRVGASLLAAVGLDELVAHTPKEYVALATGLAGDLDRLAALRAGLRPRMATSPLCDKADYARAVDISTRGAMREMVLPGVLAIAAPIVVGTVLGAEALGGLLVGAIVTGFLLAIMMANAGGAWDNAKKYIEAGYMGGKGTDAHAAAVVGDTVGDPFKDTSGPSLNILIKLMSIVALVFAPLFL